MHFSNYVWLLLSETGPPFSASLYTKALINNLGGLACFADVCAAVRGREPGPARAHLAAAEGEDPGHHRLVHAAVPRVRVARQEAHQDVPQVVQEDQAHQGAGRHRHGQREYVLLTYS